MNPLRPLGAVARTTFGPLRNDLRVRSGLAAISDYYWGPQRQREVRANTVDFIDKLEALRRGAKLPEEVSNLIVVSVGGIWATPAKHVIDYGKVVARMENRFKIGKWIEGDINSQTSAHAAGIRLASQVKKLDPSARQVVWLGHSFGAQRIVHTLAPSKLLQSQTRGVLFSQAVVLGHWATSYKSLHPLAMALALTPNVARDASYSTSMELLARTQYPWDVIPHHSLATIAKPSFRSLLSPAEFATRMITGEPSDGLNVAACAGFRGADVLLGPEHDINHFELFAKSKKARQYDPALIHGALLWQMLELPDPRGFEA